MDSLATIINDLKSIATSMNYTGPTVDALIYLLANGVQKNNLNATVAILEASSTRCKLINSAIQHAKDMGYSVNRGTNQHIVVPDLMVLETRKVKRFDQAAKVGNYYLYFAEDITLKSGALETIDFIVGKTPLEETLQVESELNLLRLTSRLTNYSSEIEIQGKDGETIQYTEDRYTILTNENVHILVNTTTDYGVELYIYSHDANKSILTNNTDEEKISKFVYFNPGEVYTIKGVAFEENMIDPSAVKSIPGFKFTPATYTKGLASYSPVSRESDVTEIYLNSQKAYDSSFVLRSMRDVKLGLPLFTLGDNVTNPIKHNNVRVYYYGGTEPPFTINDTASIQELFPPGPGEPEFTELQQLSDTEPNTLTVTQVRYIKEMLLQPYPDSLKNIIEPFDETLEHPVSPSEALKNLYNLLIWPLYKHEEGDQYPVFTIYYLTKDLDEYIRYNEINSLIEALRSAYYVSQKIVFIKAIPHINTKPGSDGKLRFHINLFYTQILNTSEIEEFIQQYSYDIGVKYDPDAIIGALTRHFDGIDHISYQETADTEPQDLADCEYKVFDIKLMQTPVVDNN